MFPVTWKERKKERLRVLRSEFSEVGEIPNQNPNRKDLSKNKAELECRGRGRRSALERKGKEWGGGGGVWVKGDSDGSSEFVRGWGDTGRGDWEVGVGR